MLAYRVFEDFNKLWSNILWFCCKINTSYIITIYYVHHNKQLYYWYAKLHCDYISFIIIVKIPQ